MKFLFDICYTNRPRVCSTSYLVWNLIQDLIKWRDDTFFYVLYPPNKMEATDWQFLNQFPDRVTLLPLHQCTSDRISEEYMLRNQLRYYLNPWCEYAWDVDIVVSSRIPVLKHMRVHAARDNGKAMRSLRMYVGLDEMPILPFRKTIPWSDSMYPDTLISYGLVDAVIINNQWTKTELKLILKEVFSPSWQQKIMNNIHEAVPEKLERFTIRDTLFNSGEFRLSFVGRITKTRNFDGVADLFRKQFSYPVGKNRDAIKICVSTNSEVITGKMGEIGFIDIQMNDRKRFHEFLDKSHLVVNLSTVEDFSLSTYEALRRGVPVLVSDKPWTNFLGPSYPFRVHGLTDAYAMVSSFISDYATQYQKFVEWENTYWKKYVEGSFNVSTGEVLIRTVSEFEKKRQVVCRDRQLGGAYVSQVKKIPSVRSSINLTEYIKQHGRMLGNVSDHFSLPVGRVPATLLFKLVAEQLGYVDTNDTGVMKKRESI